MKEIIEKIEEVDDYNMQDHDKYPTHGDGYKITTNEQEILIVVDNSSSCCEQWGYFSSEDNLKDFVGAEINNINLVDTALNVKAMEKEIPYGVDCGDTMFVNIETNKGTLQLAVYNSHNGYYGHTAYLKSKQLTETRGL